MGSSAPTLPKIRACLFDMDGLLIDSEDKYSDATNTVLARYNKPTLPWEIKAKLQGRPGPQSVEIFQDWAQLPIPPSQYVQELGELQKQLFPTCQPLPGVLSLLENLKKSGVEMALATSSHKLNYELKSSHLQHLFNYFEDAHKVLGDDPRIPKGRGKPAPDIYILALSTINATRIARGESPIKRSECLVFEDSVPGAEAGIRAGMQVAWVPYRQILEVFRGSEEKVLAGLTGEHTPGEEDALRYAEIEGGEGEGERKVGAPGEIGDGYGRLFESLVDFPYNSYGIDVPQ